MEPATTSEPDSFELASEANASPWAKAGKTEAAGHAAAEAADMPLAARMRPLDYADYAGQAHLLGPSGALRRAVEGDVFVSILLYGPPGVGKTSLAELIARKTSAAFVRLSGVSSTVADIRREVERAKLLRRSSGRRTILFVDELHRFNKAQQDALLPDVESGAVRFVGATTENPCYHVVAPLLSRSMLFRLEPLSREDILAVLRRALSSPRGYGGRPGVPAVGEDALAAIAAASEGDARRALNSLEFCVESLLKDRGEGSSPPPLDAAAARSLLLEKACRYSADEHYDTASAFIKSMRGSDPDAAVYWLAKMLAAGEDIRFIARRIAIFAAEDVGNADPRALELAAAAMGVVERVGMPEARIILSQAALYCACAPKSNASYLAVDRAAADIAAGVSLEVPPHLRDASRGTARSRLGHGVGYEYPHDCPHGFSPQPYLPGAPRRYYEPKDVGFESKIRERLAFWDALRRQAAAATGAAASGQQS